MSEQRTFVFSVTFIILFSVFLATIPVGLQGLGDSPENLTPLEGNLIYGFSSSANYMRPNFTTGIYEYELNSLTWRCTYSGSSFSLASKQLIFGWLWLGGLYYVYFIDANNTNLGLTLSMNEIGNNSVDGFATYSLQDGDSGSSAGTLNVYWNDTYSDPETAWLADELYITHGIGFETTAVIDVGTLLIQLLFLQLPDVPLLVNIILVAPIWACVIYLIWYIIKEMIPFL